MSDLPLRRDLYFRACSNSAAPPVPSEPPETACLRSLVAASPPVLLRTSVVYVTAATYVLSAFFFPPSPALVNPPSCGSSLLLLISPSNSLCLVLLQSPSVSLLPARSLKKSPKKNPLLLILHPRFLSSRPVRPSSSFLLPHPSIHPFILPFFLSFVRLLRPGVSFFCIPIISAVQLCSLVSPVSPSSLFPGSC